MRLIPMILAGLATAGNVMAVGDIYFANESKVDVKVHIEYTFIGADDYFDLKSGASGLVPRKWRSVHGNLHVKHISLAPQAGGKPKGVFFKSSQLPWGPVKITVVDAHDGISAKLEKL